MASNSQVNFDLLPTLTLDEPGFGSSLRVLGTSCVSADGIICERASSVSV